ncbi:mucin-2 [Scaptodrosophila lebanonensis]|uniref:Mucin-2 n=1 Tax=Drosophila lebanonensis TaxID=7225 RepID=A0A6J2UGT1_DROLE|nr:mucin-2 [Scaptodrosophila lebanonensis]
MLSAFTSMSRKIRTNSQGHRMWILTLMTVVVGAWASPIDDAEASGGRLLFDQRQTGKYNIHVSIKDVAIIEVDQNEIADETYSEEDYYYDDSDLTIKPIKFPTPSPATTTPITTTGQSTTTMLDAVTTSTTLSTTPDVSTAPTSIRITQTTTSPEAPANTSTYSANLLADIAATQAAQRGSGRHSNLMIMETPISTSSTLLPAAYRAALRGRTRDVPVPGAAIMSTTGTTSKPAVLISTPPTRPALENIEYTPPQGQNSPIFKVKVQRTAPEAPTASPVPAPVHSSRCRPHQFRDAHGKCRAKRSGSILRKLFSMLVSLPFAGDRSMANHLQQPPSKRELLEQYHQLPHHVEG